MDETDIGIDTPDGGTDLQCRVSVAGGRSYTKTVAMAAAPGHALRVSVTARGLKHSARILAFVDPMTGKLVIRMGMFVTDKNGRGNEENEQIIWDSDKPVYTVTR